MLLHHAYVNHGFLSQQTHPLAQSAKFWYTVGNMKQDQSRSVFVAGLWESISMNDDESSGKTAVAFAFGAAHAWESFTVSFYTCICTQMCVQLWATLPDHIGDLSTSWLLYKQTHLVRLK